MFICEKVELKQPINIQAHSTKTLSLTAAVCRSSSAYGEQRERIRRKPNGQPVVREDLRPTPALN